MAKETTQPPGDTPESSDSDGIDSVVFDVPRSPVVSKQKNENRDEVITNPKPPAQLTRGYNWPQVYHEYIQGDPIEEIAPRHGIRIATLRRVVKENQWDLEQRRMFRVIQEGIKDRLEDLAIEEAERTVRTHFAIINKALMRTMDLLPQVRDPRSAKEFASAIDVLTKAQRLAVGITNYVTDPNKNTKEEGEAADDLDRALGILEEEGDSGAS